MALVAMRLAGVAVPAVGDHVCGVLLMGAVGQVDERVVGRVAVSMENY